MTLGECHDFSGLKMILSLLYAGTTGLADTCADLEPGISLAVHPQQLAPWVSAYLTHQPGCCQPIHKIQRVLSQYGRESDRGLSALIEIPFLPISF